MQEALGQKEDKIFRIINGVLTQIFGENATALIYQHLERKYGLSQSEFSEKLDVFARGLEDFLNSGAFAVENKILTDIYSTYGVKSTSLKTTALEEYDFASQMRIIIQNA